MPKSIAPMEIRLAEPPENTITEKAKSNEQGIVNAAINETGKSPKKDNENKSDQASGPQSRYRAQSRW